jgi:hypothetical protein
MSKSTCGLAFKSGLSDVCSTDFGRQHIKLSIRSVTILRASRQETGMFRVAGSLELSAA